VRWHSAMKWLTKRNGDTLARAILCLALVIWSAGMIWLSVKSGVRHDYRNYLLQWNLVLSGENPWSIGYANAYGPLHNLLAYASTLGPLGPKLIIVTALIAANALLVAELLRTSRIDSDYVVYLLAVPTNVLIISMAFAYGLNDALVAAFIACAIVARCRGQMVLTGGILGLAILLKYYPIFLVPLFALRNGRFCWRLIAGATAMTIMGLTATMLAWGDTFLAAFSSGVERPPKLLSILSALEGHPLLIGSSDVVAFLVRANSMFVIAAAMLIVFVAWNLRLHWLESSVLGLLAVLLTYKVGNQQFFIPWLFLVAALPLAQTDSARRLAWFCVPFVLFLSAFQWGYEYASDYYRNVHGEIRRNVGFVAFPLGMAIIAAYFSTYRRSIDDDQAAIIAGTATGKKT
jgi:hypothetical protein